MDGLEQILDILGRDDSVNTGDCYSVCVLNCWTRSMVQEEVTTLVSSLRKDSL